MAWSPTRVSPEPCLNVATAVPRVQRPQPDGPLAGGTANRGLVIRVGDTVLRPAAPCRPATHALLGHLAAAGFGGAPRVLAAGPVTGPLTYTDSRRGRALERFRIFLHASGLHHADRRRVAEAVVANHDWTYAIVTEAAAAGHQGFADHWRTVAEQVTRARSWCERHRRDLLAAAR